MAEMNDRGQLLLVAGILLAVVFVGLALLVNAAIYTDNIATRGGDSASEPLAYQAGVTDAVGELIDAENAAADDTEGFGEISTRIEDGTEPIDDTLERNHLRRAATTNTEITDSSEGWLIRQNETDSFENWQANATGVRGFVIDIDTDAMAPADPPFVIDLNETQLEVNRTSGEIVVEGGTEEIECSVPVPADGTVRFDVTGERLDGEPCRFGWPEFDDDSDIALQNGMNGAGQYELTIESDEDPRPIAHETTAAVYSVVIDVRIETPELRYETTVRVAPGEPDV